MKRTSVQSLGELSPGFLDGRRQWARQDPGSSCPPPVIGTERGRRHTVLVEARRKWSCSDDYSRACRIDAAGLLRPRKPSCADFSSLGPRNSVAGSVGGGQAVRTVDVHPRRRSVGGRTAGTDAAGVPMPILPSPILLVPMPMPWVWPAPLAPAGADKTSTSWSPQRGRLACRFRCGWAWPPASLSMNMFMKRYERLRAGFC